MSFYRLSECFTAIKTSFHGNLIVSMKYSCYILTESSKSPASIAQSNKQWVGT